MLSEKLLIELKKYVEKHMITLDFSICESARYIDESICDEIQYIYLEGFIKNNRKPTFNQILFSFIDGKGVPTLIFTKKQELIEGTFPKSGPNRIIELEKIQ
jgi:hypothetical protein